MASLYFNARSWRQLGLSEQQVRFLEELAERSGGAQDVEVNITEINNIVSAVQDSTTAMLAQIQQLKHRVSQLEDAQ